jgi:hypothetical protein
MVAEQPDERIPYVHGRHLLPIRRQPLRYGNAVHARLFAREDSIRARIDRLDDALVALSEERRALLDALGSLHEQVRPRWSNTRGRRRRVISHEEPLPPTAERPMSLSGVELRAICLAFLRKARGPLTLRQLHALVHRAGYIIASWHPVKALADALGHEADVGRVERVARGTYAHPPGNRARRGPHDPADSEDDQADTPRRVDDPSSTLPDW